MKETTRSSVTVTSEISKKLILLFLIVGTLYIAKKLFIPLAIGGLLATLFLPICRWMERRKISRIFATLSCLVLLILFVSAIIAVLGWQITELMHDVVKLKARTAELLDHVQQFFMGHFGISLREQFRILQTERSSITDAIVAFVGPLTSVLTDLILTLVYVCFLLYYRTHIKDFVLQISPPSRRRQTERIIYSAAQVSQQYLVGLSKMIFCLWIMYGIGFSLLGVRNALFFAILCGFLEIVPFIGNITGTSLTVLISVVDGANVSILIGIILTYGAVQFIQGWLLEPMILGPQVKINPLFTIIALVTGELIWGIPGVVLAIPLMAIVKIVCDHIAPLKPYGFLIGELKGRERVKVLFDKD